MRSYMFIMALVSFPLSTWFGLNSSDATFLGLMFILYAVVGVWAIWTRRNTPN